jgi:hypothetical protein
MVMGIEVDAAKVQVLQGRETDTRTNDKRKSMASDQLKTHPDI